MKTAPMIEAEAETAPTPKAWAGLRRHAQGLPVYFLGSCLALTLDAAVLLLALRGGLSLGASAALGFLSGMSISYFVSVRFAFAQRSIRDRRMEYASFLFIGLLGLGATHVLLDLFAMQMRLPLLAAKAATAAIVFGFNYSLRKQLLFTRPSAMRHS